MTGRDHRPSASSVARIALLFGLPASSNGGASTASFRDERSRTGRLAPPRAESFPGRPESRGQASVELLAGIPVLVLAAAVAVQLLIVGYSLTIADGAAEAGAAAAAAGLDGGDAARNALPGWARPRSTVRTEGGLVRVELRPPSPVAALADALTVRSEAWARSGEAGR